MSGTKVGNKYSVLFLLTIMSVMVLASCEQTFDPMKENNRYHFSIFGVLDASTDTQWVRVMPVRESVLTSPEPMDAVVTLTRKSTGQVIELADSLFELRNNYYAWNYWTDSQIVHGEEYLFKATNPEGQSSTVNIFIPEDFPTPTVRYTQGNPVARVNAGQIENLVLVQIVYYYQIEGPDGLGPVHKSAFSQMEDIREAANGDLIVYTYPGQGFGEINRSNNTEITRVVHLRQEVLVVSGGPGWPELGELTEEERFLPGAISNVKTGLGILPGIVSKRVPLKSCYDNDGTLIACPLLKPESVVNVKD